MKYWYETTDKAAPVEILVDGKSIKKDGKVVEMKFHPKSYYKESKMNLKSLVKETIKEVVTERKQSNSSAYDVLKSNMLSPFCTFCILTFESLRRLVI